jgi:hypothetical protein
MSVRKRSWTTRTGEQREAWITDYTDQDGDRHIRTFDRKKDADAYWATVSVDVRNGTHTAPSKSATVAEADGNPAGKLKGTRNKTTLAVEALLDGEAETITRKAIQLAKEGDLTALRLCLDRIAPPRKDRPVLFELPPITSAADAVQASGALVAAVAEGELTPTEAGELGKLVEAYVKALEATDFAERLDKLERMTNR